MQARALRWRRVSPTLARALKAAAPSTDQSVRWRLGLIWGLLLFNVVMYSSGPTLFPINASIAKVLTQSSLVLALVIALCLNRPAFIRVNLFLVLFTILCATTTMMSIGQYFGITSVLFSIRLIIFVAVLWLTTPWWGRKDLLFCRIHLRAIFVVLSSVVIGLILAPGRAFAQAGGGRLGGVLWPIQPNGVGHFAAVFTGLTVVLWLSNTLITRWTTVGIVLGLTILVLTHSRTALLGMLLGVFVASLSLFLSQKKVRTVLAVTLVVTSLFSLSFAPFLRHWFDRGESTQQIAVLTGRSTVWSQVVSAPRTEVHVLFGYGMSDGGFNGVSVAPNADGGEVITAADLSIDSSWLSTYEQQGLFGDVIIALALLLLLGIAFLSPRGPARALALFLIIYCLVSSYAETGLGDASSYLLDLTVAMSVLMAPPVPSDLGVEN